jgi:F-type H+-transporting ATPase subunit epsilon
VQGANTRRFFVDGGFAQVKAGVVSVLTPRAMKAEDIKVAAAQQALETALAPAATPAGQEEQFKAQLRARAQLRIARRVGGEDEMPIGSAH